MKFGWLVIFIIILLIIWGVKDGWWKDFSFEPTEHKPTTQMLDQSNVKLEIRKVQADAYRQQDKTTIYKELGAKYTNKDAIARQRLRLGICKLLQEPTGFNDLVWQDNIVVLTDLVIYQTDIMRHDHYNSPEKQLKIFTRKNDILPITGLENYKIFYHFLNNKFYAVTISAVDSENWFKIINYFFKTYGSGRPLKLGDKETFRWSGKNVNIDAEYIMNKTQGFIRIYSLDALNNICEEINLDCPISEILEWTINMGNPVTAKY